MAGMLHYSKNISFAGKDKFKSMKKSYLAIIASLCAVCLLCGCGTTQEASRAVAAEAETAPASSEAVAYVDTSALDTILDIATTQHFSADTLGREDIETIVSAGINAPSAMNGQPWHFSVITDVSVLEQIMDGMSFGGGKPANKPEGFDMAMPEGMKMPEGFEGMEKPANFEAFEMPENFEGMEMPADFAPPAGFGSAPGAAVGGGSSKAGLTDAPVVIVISCEPGSEFDAGLACQNMSAAAQLMGYGSKIISSPTIALNGERQDEYRELLGIPEDMAAVALLLIGVEDTTYVEGVDGYTAASERKPAADVVTYVKP